MVQMIHARVVAYCPQDLFSPPLVRIGATWLQMMKPVNERPRICGDLRKQWDSTGDSVLLLAQEFLFIDGTAARGCSQPFVDAMPMIQMPPLASESGELLPGSH